MVNFGLFIASSKVEKYSDKYVDYDLLKGLVYDVSRRRVGASIKLCQTLESAYIQAKNFADEWLCRLESVTCGSPAWSSVVMTEAIELNQFVHINQEALRKVIKKHDKNNQSSRLLPAWKWKLDFNMSQRILDVVICMAGVRPKTTDLFDSILCKSEQDLSADTKTGSDKSTAPGSVIDTGIAAIPQEDVKGGLQKQTDSFVRQSTKYWVKPCDLAAVCSILAENIGVHSFNNNGSGWTPVSSVYLDNKKRSCYEERLTKQTGARIVRLRTYNNNNSQIFVERKVHYERWTGEDSSKDRFPIEEGQVMQLLRSDQQLRVAEKHAPLRDEIQSMVKEYELYPTLRVDYTRIAFQSPDHDHVRISLDINMRYLQESTSHMDWRTPEHQLLEEDEQLFPYAVVEIKLREPFISNPPEWLAELEKSALLHKENYFSKYLHGTFLFNGPTLRLRQPVWWDAMSFTAVGMPIAEQQQQQRFDHNDNNHEVVGLHRSKYNSLVHSDRDNDEDSSTNGGTSCVRSIAALPRSISSCYYAMKKRRLHKKLQQPLPSGRPVKIEPKTFFANERTFLTWFNSALFVASIGIAVSANDVGSRVAGGLLVSVGLLLIGYAAYKFTERTNSLLNKAPTGYQDLYGPLTLASVIAIAFLFSFLFATELITVGRV